MQLISLFHDIHVYQVHCLETTRFLTLIKPLICIILWKMSSILLLSL